MKLESILCITVLVQVGKASESDSTALLTKVQLGAQAGTEILKALGEDAFASKFKFIGHLANKVGPFLGAIGPMIGLINAFLPSSDSPQMALIKSEFAHVEAKFDQTLTKFQKLKNQILELSTRKKWAEQEMEINLMTSLLNQYFNSYNDSKNATVFKNLILEQGITGCHQAVYTLRKGMISSFVFGGNIPVAIFQYTDGNRTQTNITMTELYVLLLSGTSNLVAYNHLRNESVYAELQRNYWTDEMVSLATELAKKDMEFKVMAETQIRSDIDDKLAEFFKLNDTTFVDELFDFLSSKYYWKDWFLAILPKSDSTYVKVKEDCKETIVRFDKHNRNLVVVGVERTKPHINAGNLRLDVFKRKLIDICVREATAECLYRDLPNSLREGCNVPGLIVINSSEAPNLTIKMTNKNRYLYLNHLYRVLHIGLLHIDYRDIYAYG